MWALSARPTHFSSICRKLASVWSQVEYTVIPKFVNRILILVKHIENYLPIEVVDTRHFQGRISNSCLEIYVILIVLELIRCSILQTTNDKLDSVISLLVDIYKARLVDSKFEGFDFFSKRNQIVRFFCTLIASTRYNQTKRKESFQG